MARKPPAVVVVPDALPGYDEFEIDIEKILKADLPARFAQVSAAPLNLEHVRKLPRGAKGAYMLFESGQAVYAGKTDTTHGFQDRLERHFHTVQQRLGLDPEKLSFKAIRIMVFSNFDAEAILIAELRRIEKTALRWNNTGFGSNDPGHRREGQDPAQFDLDYPIDIDFLLPDDFITPGPRNVRDLLIEMKSKLPYTFRYETDMGADDKPTKHTVGHADHRSATAHVPVGPLTMRTLLVVILSALPDGWVATVMPNRVILYKEATIWPSARERLEK
jgi:hypothetical protein